MMKGWQDFIMANLNRIPVKGPPHPGDLLIAVTLDQPSGWTRVSTSSMFIHKISDGREVGLFLVMRKKLNG